MLVSHHIISPYRPLPGTPRNPPECTKCLSSVESADSCWKGFLSWRRSNQPMLGWACKLVISYFRRNAPNFHSCSQPSRMDTFFDISGATGLTGLIRSVRVSVFSVSVIDVEITHLVRGLVGRDNPQEVAEILRLQILLAQVLQVPLREGGLDRQGKKVYRVTTTKYHEASAMLIENALQTRTKHQPDFTSINLFLP